MPTFKEEDVEGLSKGNKKEEWKVVLNEMVSEGKELSAEKEVHNKRRSRNRNQRRK